MAVELHRTRELLPSSATREFQLSGSENDAVVTGRDEDEDDRNDLECFDYRIPGKPWDYEAFSSDYQSELALSETETETADCIAELTRDVNSQEKIKESWDFGVLSCATKIWSPFGSSYGSAEEGSSQEATSPTTPEIKKRHHVWDNHSTNGTATVNDQNTITTNMEKMNIKAYDNDDAEVPKYPPISTARFRHNQSPTNLDRQFYKLKQRSGNNKVNNQYDQLEGGENHVQIAKKVLERARQPRKWPQRAAGPGMRAVFLDGEGSRTGPPCGTGVFLPCVIGDASQSRKKKGCSPVLIPAKVMRALKDHFDRMDNLSRQNNSLKFPIPRDNTCNYAPKNNGIIYSQTRRQSGTAPATNQNDVGLPQDWTY